MGRSAAPRLRPVYLRVLGMIEDGHSLNEIARTLNREGVPSARQGRWYASTIKAIRDSKTAETITEPTGQGTPDLGTTEPKAKD